MLILSTITIYLFGTKTYINAFRNLFNYGLLNMETLITVGSLAAYIMSFFLIIIYGVETANEYESRNMISTDTASDGEVSTTPAGHEGHVGSLRFLSGDMGAHTGTFEEKKAMKIMMIMHMLESAAIILAVVTLGIILNH